LLLLYVCISTEWEPWLKYVYWQGKDSTVVGRHFLILHMNFRTQIQIYSPTAPKLEILFWEKRHVTNCSFLPTITFISMSSQRINFVQAVCKGRTAVIAKRHKSSPPRQLNPVKRRKIPSSNYTPESNGQAGPSHGLGSDSLEMGLDFDEVPSNSFHKGTGTHVMVLMYQCSALTCCFARARMTL
jgi:hypothetical protein